MNENQKVRATKALTDWFEKKITEKGFLAQFLRKWRRFYFGNFKPEYIQASIQANRKGDCHRCGLCCQLIYKCPFLGKDGQNLPYCRIYGDLRPANCHVYPFDAKDSEIAQCGYSFPVQIPSPQSEPLISSELRVLNQ